MSKCNNEKEAEASHHQACAIQSGFNGVKKEEFQMEKNDIPPIPTPNTDRKSHQNCCI